MSCCVTTENIPKCCGCGDQILDRFVLKVLDGSWHSKCLKCSDCQLPLNDKCFAKDDKVFCKDDFFRSVPVRRFRFRFMV